MLAKTIAAGLAGSALLVSVAFAENPVASDTASQGTWRASKVVGLNVYNDSNENVGSINDLLMDKSGDIKTAVISVGGFLGVGARLVAVPFDKVKFSSEPVSSGMASSSGTSGGAAGSRPMSSTTTTGAATTTSKPNPWYPDHAMYSATKDDLQKMPEFKYSE
jgi:sporulation protein YlmC with PRC-barrel domain